MFLGKERTMDNVQKHNICTVYTGLKMSGREIGNSVPSSANIKNVYGSFAFLLGVVILN
jgi:hypothetical protein